MQLISQESLAVEINYLEGNGPEWFMHKGLLLILTEAEFCEGERKSIYWCMPVVLTLHLFSFWLFSFVSFPHTCFFSISWSIFSNFYSLVMVPVIAPSFFVLGKVLFLKCLPRLDFTVLALNLLCQVWVYWPTTTGSTVCHPPSPDKEGYFVYLSVVAPFPTTV